MRHKLLTNLTTFLFPFILFAQPAKLAPQWVVQAPAGERYCQIDTAGETIIPNGRIVKPMGKTFRIAPHPFGLALSNDGRTAVTANSGNRPFSIATDLYVSVNTVKTHLSSIYRKLGVTERNAAITRASDLGLL